MPEPILAVDLADARTLAVLVAGERWYPVDRPGLGGGAWPRAGTPVDPSALAALLGPIRREAERGSGLPVTRLAAAAAEPDHAAVVRGGETAGFVDVDLVPAPAAVVLDPTSGPGWRPGEVVLACHLDDRLEAWQVALVRVGGAVGEWTTVLARAAASAPELAGGLRRVADAGAALARAAGVDLAGAVLTGGWAARGDVVRHLQRALPGRVRPAVEPEAAVLRGAAWWAASAAHRRVPAEPPRWRVAPLSWRIPDQDGRVLRWLVPEGTPFAAGTVLAQVRTRTDRVYDLAADADGALLAHGPGAGAATGPTLVAAVAPAVMAAAYDPPPHRHRWRTAGGVMLAGPQLVEWEAAGTAVQARDIADGSVTVELSPDHGATRPQHARGLLDPAGRLCLLTWNLAGDVWVWDVAAGELRTRFTGPAGAQRLLVDEQRWRLAVEAGDAVSVGRYRRTSVTLWDLASGQRLERLVADDWQRHHPGFAPRSAADRFATAAVSPDQRLRTVASGGAVTLYETATDHPVFRTPASAGQARTAFSADGRFLLVSSEADDRSEVDVWEL